MKLSTLFSGSMVFMLVMVLCSRSFCQNPKLVIPFGHQFGIQKSFFSNDNKYLITSDEAFTIISDIRSGKPLYYLEGVNPSVSNDDKYIVTLDRNNVLVWLTAGGKLFRKIPLTGEATSASVSSARNMVLITTKWVNTPGQGGKRGTAPSQGGINASLWDINTGTVQQQFSPAEENSGCDKCTLGACALYGCWLNKGGDSIRLVYGNHIRSFEIGKYTSYSGNCLENSDGMAYAKQINNGFFTTGNEGAGNVYDEQGNLVDSWEKDDKTMKYEVVTVSRNGKLIVRYTSEKVNLQVVQEKIKTYTVTGLKKISVNDAGNLLLLEFFDQFPRFFSIDSLKEANAPSPENKQGFPQYVYVTKTEEMPELFSSVFASLRGKLNQLNQRNLGKLVNWGIKKRIIDDPLASVKQGINGMERDANAVYTNTGEIVSMTNNRTISKIRSLIKLTGDINFSPDGKTMLLNTSKSVTAYSIPYAKAVSNQSSIMNSKFGAAFSRDNKWLLQYAPGDSGAVLLINQESGKMMKKKLAFLPTEFVSVSFANNNKNIIAQSQNGKYFLLDGESCEIIQYGTGKIFSFDKTGRKYGYINTEDKSIHIISQKDSSELYKFFPPKPKADEKPGEVDNTAEYTIEFSETGDAVLFPTAEALIYVRDINKPQDTMMFSKKSSHELTSVVLSPNGQYVQLEIENDHALLIDPDKKNAPIPIGPDPGDEKKGGSEDDPKTGQEMGKMFKQMSSGNTSWGDKLVAGFSRTGDSIGVARGGKLYMYLCKGGKLLKTFEPGGMIKYFNLSQNLLVSDYHGQLKFFRLTEEKEWFSMLPFKNGESVFMLPDGIYYGSKANTRNLVYVYDDKALSYKQFDFNGNRPDIVLRTLGNTDAKYLAIFDSAFSIRKKKEGLKEQQKMNFSSAPEIAVLNENEIPGETTDSIILFKVNVKSRGRNLDRLAVFVNGNPIISKSEFQLPAGKDNIQKDVRISLTDGKNIIEISAFDVNGQESYRYPAFVQYNPVVPIHPNVYFIGIGASKYSNSSRNLSWARKDIVDVLDTISRRYPSSKVFVDTLFNNEVTRDRLLRLKQNVKNSRPGDVVIIYYSGHGEIDVSKGEAYFGTFDMDFAKPASKGISIKDLSSLAEGVNARNKVILIDACHSGEINSEAWKNKKAEPVTATIPATTSDDEIDKLVRKKGTEYSIEPPGNAVPFNVSLELFTDLYQGNGTNIIVASRGLDAAKECDEFEHGVFTFSVLKGLTHLSADEDSNSVLTIYELKDYILESVDKFSLICKPTQVQKAVYRKENEFNDWAVVDNSSGKIKTDLSTIMVFERESLVKKMKKILKKKKEIEDLINGKGTESNSPKDKGIKKIKNFIKGF